MRLDRGIRGASKGAPYPGRSSLVGSPSGKLGQQPNPKVTAGLHCKSDLLRHFLVWVTPRPLGRGLPPEEWLFFCFKEGGRGRTQPLCPTRHHPRPRHTPREPGMVPRLTSTFNQSSLAPTLHLHFIIIMSLS